MRNFVILIIGALLSLYACQSPPSHADNTRNIVAVSDGSGESFPEAESSLTLDDIPVQSNKPNTASFAGTYVLPQTGGLSFEVDLVQKGDSVLGSYCGYTETRHDCGTPSQGAPDCEIKGVIRNNVAYLIFRSCYMDKQGKAHLTPHGKNVIWNTTLYPNNEDGMGFCAAPDSTLLITANQEFASPVVLPSFKAQTRDFLIELPEAETYYIFNTTKVLHTTSGSDFKTHLQTGTPVRILREEDDFVYTQIGDETFEMPAYLIEYEEYGQKSTGYIHFGDIALHHFKDSRGNLFLLGLEGEEDLEWKVRDHTWRWQAVSTGVKALIETKGGYFPLFQYHIQTLPGVSLDGFTFLQCDLAHKDNGNRYAHATILTWDGKELSPLLPLTPGMLYQNPVLSRKGDRLELGLQTVKSAYQDTFYQEAKQYRAFEVQDGKLRPASSSQDVTVELAYLGDNNEFTFPDTLENHNWYGVRSVEDRIHIEPVSLEIRKEQAENEIIGKWVKKAITSQSGREYDFLISGLPVVADSFARKPITFSDGEFNAGQEKFLQLPGTDWRFTALGRTGEHNEDVEFTLLLTGTKEGKVIEQPLHFSPFREMPVAFLWAGDLDGDQLPDFIINVAEKGLTTDTRLYLSGSVGTGQLVRLSGTFYSDMPGC